MSEEKKLDDMKAAEMQQEDKAAKNGEETEKIDWKKEIVSYAKIILVCSLIALAVRFLTPLIFVDGQSMDHTLYDKELCIGCTFIGMDRGDIIVFKNASTNGKNFIKRIIGKPGDTIRIDGETIYVNDEKIEESYIWIDPEAYPLLVEEELVLDDDQYFVCGDNRRHSNDSRFIGPIRKADIEAKVILPVDMRWLTDLFKK